MSTIPQTTHAPRTRRAYRAVTATLSGLLFGALVYRALVDLPPVYPGQWNLVVALAAGLLYAVLPPLGAGIGLPALLVPITEYSRGGKIQWEKSALVYGSYWVVFDFTLALVVDSCPRPLEGCHQFSQNTMTTLYKSWPLK